jgi:hypothetical protein
MLGNAARLRRAASNDQGRIERPVRLQRLSAELLGRVFQM